MLLISLRPVCRKRNDRQFFPALFPLLSILLFFKTFVWRLTLHTYININQPNVRARFHSLPSSPTFLPRCVPMLCLSPKRERNLLGTAYDWESNARPASFDDVRRRHQALPANQLARVTAQYLRQQQAGAAAAAGSSSGTAIVVAEERPPSTTGPAVSRSLLSRVEPFGHDREANEVCTCTYIPRTYWYCT